jgi:CSLREA domain-containing protein
MPSQISVSGVDHNLVGVRAPVGVKRSRVIALIVVIMTLILIAPQLVQASHMARPSAQLVVNMAVDENDGSCSDGDCSLRDAIAMAADSDTITFSGNYTIYLSSTLTINKRLTVDASGRIIKVSGDTGGDGSSNVRVFSIGSSGVVTLTFLNIVSGTATLDGGGIYNVGTLTVQNSTLAGNSAARDGGGVYNNGTLNVINSTFTGNHATEFGGGMIGRSGSTVTVLNSTFAGNNAKDQGGGVFLYGGGTINNSIIANNSSMNNCWGTISGSNNLADDASCGSSFTHSTTILLGTLGYYGGSTQTFPLLPESRAIDGANSSCPAIDQRGVARSASTCDIGAFESSGFTLTKTAGDNQTTLLNTTFADPLALTVVANNASEPVNGGHVILTAPTSGASIMEATPLALTIAGESISRSVTANRRAGSYQVTASARGTASVNFTLTNSCWNTAVVANANDSGPGSLREAIYYACANGAITFSDDYTITLASELLIERNLTIDGAGHQVTVSGNAAVRVFFIGSSGVVTLTNLSIVSGTIIGDVGGGIYNWGTLTVQRSTLSDNSAEWGGGIYNDGTLTVQSSTLSGNSSATHDGGGIYNRGALTVQSSTFSGNSTAYYGGGLFSSGTSTVQNSTFSGNSAGVYGGGLANYGTSTVRNSTLSDNSAGTYGGGIFNVSTLQLYNTLIANSPTGGDCHSAGGTIATNDHNLLQSTLITDTCGLTNGAGGSLIGVDPLPDPLADNGGATWTHALLPGSPALDAGNNATCLTTDQRGVTRPQGAACDIGAYEVAHLSLTKFVTPATQVPYHGVVTYTLILALDQGDAVVDPNIILTDTLPDHVIFNSWVISPINTLQAGQAITWTGALTAGQALTFTFTAIHTGGLREWVTNTATFSGTTWVGSALAGFQVTAYAITPTAGGGGTITPSTLQVVNAGESRVFTITPDPGYHILDVGVDGVSVGVVNIYTFTNVTADQSISATFGLNEYTMTTGVVGQGQVTRTPDQATYLFGSVVTLTAIPQAGWYFGQWSGGASGALTQTTVLMDASKVVTATFFNVPQTYYTLTLSLIGSGVITPTVGARTYLSGTMVSLSASPESGWQFAGWSGNADCADGSVTLNANKSCTATFARYQVYLPLVLKY